MQSAHMAFPGDTGVMSQDAGIVLHSTVCFWQLYRNYFFVAGNKKGTKNSEGNLSLLGFV